MTLTYDVSHEESQLEMEGKHYSRRYTMHYCVPYQSQDGFHALYFMPLVFYAMHFFLYFRYFLSLYLWVAMLMIYLVLIITTFLWETPCKGSVYCLKECANLQHF